MNDQNEISHQKMSKVMINDRERPGNVRQSARTEELIQEKEQKKRKNDKGMWRVTFNKGSSHA